MKKLKLIKNSIREIPRGKPFTAAHLRKIRGHSNVRQSLARLVNSGEIARASRGIYVRPKTNPYLGEVMPTTQEIIKTISKQTGETITLHGAEAARMLQLSTQVPMQAIYYTSGTTRIIKLGKRNITLKHISPRKQVKPGSMTCVVITALWYLGKEHVNAEVILQIKNRLSEKEYSEVLKHTHQMPAWMANAFESDQK